YNGLDSTQDAQCSVMSRHKVVLVVLLPGLFFFTWGHVLLAAGEERGTPGSCSCHSGLEGTKNCPSSPASDADAVAGAIPSRVAKYSGKGSVPTGTHILHSFSAQPPALPHLSSDTSCPEFVNSWQFLCRTALNPRAPCFVS